jgi:DNA-binding PadR family transcriptional regulator
MSVRNAILGLLAQKPRHGYELRAAFEALVGGEDVWDVKPAQVYTTLTRLEESGLVRQEGIEQDGGPEKRIYALTSEGTRELGHWFKSGIADEPKKDEFFVKLMLSLGSDEITPYQVIQAQRSHLYQGLHDLTVLRTKSDPKSELAQIFLLDKIIMHLEADLRWLDMVEARLDDISKQPALEPEIRPRGRPKKK